jgi:aminomuconate-semialdehyde/2-hydroxymuconate-6-semialdehyde dehydrogenase
LQFINGEVITKTDGIKLTKCSPFTGSELFSYSCADVFLAVSAIQAANRAYLSWKTSTLTERKDLIQKIKTNLRSKEIEFASLEAVQQGLPLEYIIKHEFHYLYRLIDQLLSEEPTELYAPMGVITIVTSWNLSLRLILERALPAILAGNSVVIKVSSQCPGSTVILSELLQSAALPKGLVNIMVGSDIEVVNAIVSHPSIKGVSVVGSVETSTSILKAVASTAHQSFKKIQIFSGSKNSAVVLTEPTEPTVNEILRTFLLGQGQLHWNSARLFVLERHADLWTEAIRQTLSTLKPAESIEDSSVWTPIIKSSSFDRFGEILRQAKEDQAKLVRSEYSLSDQQEKNFLSPVFTQDMSRCSTLQQDQIHAPFFILSAVKYPFDIPKYSNVSYYGAATHLWGREDQFTKVVNDLEVGQICYNKSSVEYSPVPAVKQSGFGLQDLRPFGAFYSNAKNLS